MASDVNGSSAADEPQPAAAAEVAGAATTRAQKGATTAAKRPAASGKAPVTSAQARAKATPAPATRRAKTVAAERSGEPRRTQLGDVAERAVLTSVGAALTARDTVVESVNGISRKTAEERLRKARRAIESDLRRFERRGASARTALERKPALRSARAQADLAAARLSGAVESAQLAGATVVAKVTERVAGLV